MAVRGARRARIVIRSALAAVVVLAGILVPAAPAEARAATIERLGGSDRYATAAAISHAVFAQGVSVAFIATGQDFPDALAGGPAAGRRKAPILLTARGQLPEATRTELVRLEPASIVVLGGPSVVSSAVEDALRGYTLGSVTRIAGTNRFRDCRHDQ